MSRPRSTRAEESAPRTYGGTWFNSFERHVLQFFDRNRDEVLTVADSVTKFGIGCTSRALDNYVDDAQARRKLEKLLGKGWLAYSEEVDANGKHAYCAGPAIHALSILPE